MTFQDTLSLALRNLRQSRLRTSLTTLGVAIGIASLSGMVSLGVGLQEQVVGRLTQSGVFDSITVSSGGGIAALLGAPGGGRGGRGGRQGGARTTTPLDDAAIARIEALPHVTHAYPNVRVSVGMVVPGFSGAVTALGVPDSARGIGAFQTIAHGAFFPDAESEAAMLTLDMATQINEQNPGSLVGQVITLSDTVATPAEDAPEGARIITRTERAFPIVGIVDRDPDAGLASQGLAGLMIPIFHAKQISETMVTNAQSLLRPALNRPRTYPTVTVRVAGAQHTQDVQTQIKAMGLTTFSLHDALQGAKRAFLLLDILLAVIGSIALAVSSLGIVNTMVMSILERTREIGIMKAIGGSDRDVRGIFLVEAATIGLLGGVVGILLGWSVGRLINIGANMYIESQGGPAGNLFSLPWWLIGGALLFALLISLVAGSYPARRAARLDPIQALRHE
ncbi:MAG: ABC transporter permease [Acidobacteria bacterium]|nr:ABC transporter permease [Acidobacteriota bacterium]